MGISGLVERLRDRYNGSDIAHRMATGAFWSFTGSAFAKFMVLAAGILCARILGKDLYGELGMVRSTITLFTTLGVTGLGLTATKFISEHLRETPERIPSIYLLTSRFALATGLVVSALIVALAPAIAEVTLDSPYLANDIRWGGIILFFTILNGVQQGILSGFEDFKSIATNTLWGSITESVLMCVGACYAGVTGAIVGFGSGFVVMCVFNRITISRILRNNGLKVSRSMFNRRDLRLIFTFSLPAVLSSLIVAPVFWIIKAMLVNQGGYGQLAVFEAADQWKIIILFIPASISNIVLPILSSLVKSDHNRFWRVLKINMILNASVALALSAAVCLFASNIMALYGREFVEPAILMILCASTVFSSMANVIGISLSSRNKVWVGFAFNLNWGFMTALFCHIFLGHGYGAEGLALAILLSYAIHTTLQFVYLRLTVRNELERKTK